MPPRTPNPFRLLTPLAITATTATLLCIPAFALSKYRSVHYETARGSWIGLEGGALDLGRAQPSRWIGTGQPPGLHIGRWPEQHWWHDVYLESYDPSVKYAVIPLWMLAAPTAAIALASAALARRHTARTRLGACPHCGYDRRHSPTTTPCPECGNHAAA